METTKALRTINSPRGGSFPEARSTAQSLDAGCGLVAQADKPTALAAAMASMKSRRLIVVLLLMAPLLYGENVRIILAPILCAATYTMWAYRSDLPRARLRSRTFHKT